MENIRDLKRRVKSVNNIQHITGAMKMVAASKLRRVQKSLNLVTPYEKRLIEVIGQVSQCQTNHPYMEEREVKKAAYVVIGGDLGLCGAFNNNINRFGEKTLDQSPYPYSLIVIGARTKSYFEKRGRPIDLDYTSIADKPEYIAGKEIGKELSRLFINKEVDKVYLLYTLSESVLSQKLILEQLLPVPSICPLDEEHEDYILEPNGDALLDIVLPQYVELTAYLVLLESKISEMASRMTAMSAATDNAEDLISKLTLTLNRARQAVITTEISEIVGGASALL